MIPAILQNSASTLEAIASRDAAKAREWAKRYGIPRFFSSYDALLESGCVDGVYLPLPNSLHAPWTVRALEAGYHVLCEKPLTLDGEEAEYVAEVAVKTKKLVVEAYMYRHHPVYSRLETCIADGLIGKPVTLHSQFTFMLDEDDSIVDSAGLGGGALMDVGGYCVHFSRMIAGCEPVAVSAFARFDTVDRTLTGTMQFPTGVLATFQTGIESAEHHRAEIHGETGILVLENPWHPGETEARIVLKRHEEADRIIPALGGNAYGWQVSDFVAACRGEKPARWSISDAVGNMNALDALRTSAKTGRVVHL